MIVGLGRRTSKLFLVLQPEAVNPCNAARGMKEDRFLCGHEVPRKQACYSAAEPARQPFGGWECLCIWDNPVKRNQKVGERLTIVRGWQWKQSVRGVYSPTLSKGNRDLLTNSVARPNERDNTFAESGGMTPVNCQTSRRMITHRKLV